MLGAAGGHNDYGGNEVNAITLNSDTPTWVQLRAPTANADILGGASDGGVDDSWSYYADGRPSATHNFYATQFIDSLNKMLVMPSPGYTGPASGTVPGGWASYKNSAAYGHIFDVATGDWTSPATMATYTGPGDWTAALVAKHPTTEDIYYSRGNSWPDGWWRYRPSTNTWTQLGSEGRNPWYAGAAVDPTRDRILVVGSSSGTLDPVVLDLNGDGVSATFSGTSLVIGGYPAVVYDDANDTFLVIHNSGGYVEIKRVNASTWAVDAPTVTGTKPTERDNGIQSSAQYVPELNGVVIANEYSGNVKFMRTA